MPVQDKNHKTIEIGDEVVMHFLVEDISEGGNIKMLARHYPGELHIATIPEAVIIQRKAKKETPQPPPFEHPVDDADPASGASPT